MQSARVSYIDALVVAVVVDVTVNAHVVIEWEIFVCSFDTHLYVRASNRPEYQNEISNNKRTVWVFRLQSPYASSQISSTKGMDALRFYSNMWEFLKRHTSFFRTRHTVKGYKL